MQLTIDVPAEDLVTYGKETVHKEIASTLKFMKIRPLFQKIAAELQLFDIQTYFQELDAIRAETWQEYKQGLV